jgi:hypothetical protein
MNYFVSAFPYNRKYVDSLEITLSPGRLGLYERLSSGKLENALQLYCWNTGLSQALYWPLHAFEVSLRNAMADRIADQYGNDWYERIAGFSSSKRQTPSDEVQHIEKAKRKLDDERAGYGHDAIVAAVSLGFWAGLLKDEYKAKLWDALFCDIFQMIEREEAFNKTYHIKSLRNNVAHYAPILVLPPAAKKRELFKDYKLIIKIIRWICPDTAQWVEYHSSANFFNAWNCCPDFFQMPKLTVKNVGDEADSQNWRWA